MQNCLFYECTVSFGVRVFDVTEVQRIQTTLTIVVETIHFDPTVCTLHLKGRNAQENAHVKLGAYHTLDLELNRPFTIEKPCWDTMDLHRLELCADLSNTADVAAVIMHEGFANLCLLSSSMTVTKAKIDMQIARKRKGLTHQQRRQTCAQGSSD
ncbi:eRF1 domain 1 domain-containing protein [Ditylenchus destructor]|nr:eRF1 domain 1 domain-containing protein [Ditylenchus destructor]